MFTQVRHATHSLVTTSFLIERVINLTCFGSPKTTRGRIFEDNDKDNSDDRAFKTSGIYALIGHINHACISNCLRSFIGDVQIVRATQDLEPDTELFFWYQPPREFASYDETQKRLGNWGFKCDCELCLARKKTSNKTVLRRRALFEALKKAMENISLSNRAVDVDKARKILDQLEETYSAAQREPGAVRLELWDPYIALGNMFLMRDKRFNAIEVTVLGLEALGFVIVADAPGPRGGSNVAKPSFTVKKWGLVNESCVGAFMNLFRAYRALAPELSVVLREYVETAFSMVVGEKDTVRDVYPELCI